MSLYGMTVFIILKKGGIEGLKINFYKNLTFSQTMLSLEHSIMNIKVIKYK